MSVSEAKPTAILNPADASILERIVVYIAHNHNRPIKISDIGRAVGLHPDYANAIFKKAFGCTLSRYVAEERIGQVKRKLILTDMSITQIAFECGFNSTILFLTSADRLPDAIANKTSETISGCYISKFYQSHTKAYHAT